MPRGVPPARTRRPPAGLRRRRAAARCPRRRATPRRGGRRADLRAAATTSAVPCGGTGRPPAGCRRLVAAQAVAACARGGLPGVGRGPESEWPASSSEAGWPASASKARVVSPRLAVERLLAGEATEVDHPGGGVRAIAGGRRVHRHAAHRVQAFGGGGRGSMTAAAEGRRGWIWALSHGRRGRISAFDGGRREGIAAFFFNDTATT